MRRTLGRIRSLGYIFWQARHMSYHVTVGLLWAWFLRERWGEFNPVWVASAAIGSLLPDLDHLFFFFGYGRKSAYTNTVALFWKKHEWRNLVTFLSTNHKYNTSLSYHNLYTVLILTIISLSASHYDWQAGVVLFGAMVSHYVVDVADDVVQLGGINPNWKRWGRPK